MGNDHLMMRKGTVPASVCGRRIRLHFAGWVSPARSPMMGSAHHVARGSAGEYLSVGFSQLADDPARDAGGQHTRRHRRTGKDDCAGRDQGAGTDSRAAQNNRANANERASADVCAVHDGPVPEADAILERDRLAPIHMDAAQILDIALGSDHDPIGVRAQYRPVPDGSRSAEGDVPDDNRARRDPGIWMDNGAIVTERTDQVACQHFGPVPLPVARVSPAGWLPMELPARLPIDLIVAASTLAVRGATRRVRRSMMGYCGIR